MKSNLLILLILNIIKYIYLKDSNVSLIIYDNSYIKETYNLSILNKDDAIISTNPAKLAYITDINNTDSVIFNYYSKYYNRIWVFYISNLRELSKVLSKDFEDIDITITGIIIPKSLNYQITYENNQNNIIPIIEIDDKLNKVMEEYDIRVDNRNTYFVIKLINNLELPIGYLIFFSIFALIYSIFISLYWNIVGKRVGPNYIFNYHDKIKYVFCAHIFLALTLVFKTISIIRIENHDLTVTVEISLILSCSFFKSILWFLIYLIAYGWCVCFQDLLISEQKKLLRLLLFIIVTFWLGDLLEKYCGKLWVFRPTEIKNLILYSFLTFIIVRNINKNKNFLNRKYNYALTLLPDYVDGILAKIKLLSNLKTFVLSYIPLYIINILIHKLFLYDYDSSLLLIYNFLIPDFILEFLFVFLMRPKIVPAFYDVDLGDIFNEIEGNTFKCDLPNFDDRFDYDEDIISVNKKVYDTDEIPIVVIGPYNDINNSFISDKSDIIENDLNKYFSKINIGYCNNND